MQLSVVKLVNMKRNQSILVSNMKTIELNEQQMELLNFLLEEVLVKNYSKTDQAVAKGIIKKLTEE